MQNSVYYKYRVGKEYWRRLNQDEQIEAALRDKLFKDRSKTESNPVHKELALSGKPQYTTVIQAVSISKMDLALISKNVIANGFKIFISRVPFYKDNGGRNCGPITKLHFFA